MATDSLTRLLLALRTCLSDDLLKPKYRKRYREVNTAGHCYVASEAVYHLVGKKLKYKPYYVKVNGDTHWFLMHVDKVNILDPTYDQFKTLPSYKEAKHCAFLTKKPSKRCRTLLQRIRKSLNLNNEKLKRITTQESRRML